MRPAHIAPSITLALLVPAVIVSCSRTIEEPPVRYERRTDSCETWCDVVMDRECGGANDNFADVDACVVHCTGEESLNWGLQEDGTDKCFDEQVAFHACFEDLSCELRRDWFTDLENRPEHPCRDPLDRVFDCT